MAAVNNSKGAAAAATQAGGNGAAVTAAPVLQQAGQQQHLVLSRLFLVISCCRHCWCPASYCCCPYCCMLPLLPCCYCRCCCCPCCCCCPYQYLQLYRSYRSLVTLHIRESDWWKTSQHITRTPASPSRTSGASSVSSAISAAPSTSSAPPTSNCRCDGQKRHTAIVTTQSRKCHIREAAWRVVVRPDNPGVHTYARCINSDFADRMAVPLEHGSDFHWCMRAWLDSSLVHLTSQAEYYSIECY